MSHARCEACADNPPDQPHCWVKDYIDDEGDASHGMPYGACRHCEEVARICDVCDGDGTLDGDSLTDCPHCEGWGMIRRHRETMT